MEEKRAYWKAVQRNHKLNLMSTSQKEYRSLRNAFNNLPEHPTKPTFDQLKEWIHDAVCNICHKTKSGNKRQLGLDHNHETGEFRGFLCDDCNKLLGFLHDDVSVLDRIKAYLDDPPARSFV